MSSCQKLIGTIGALLVGLSGRQKLIAAIVVSLLSLSFLMPTLPPGGGSEGGDGQPASPGSFKIQELDFVLLIVVDCSGSFYNYVVGDDAPAFKFCLRALEQMWSKRLVNPRDRIIIATISADEHAIRWQGDGRDFRASFGDQAAFRKAIFAGVNPNGSRVHDSIAQALDHILDDRNLSKKTHITTLILSDMDNNMGRPDSLPRLQYSFKKLADHGGSAGLFWVDDAHYRQWRDFLRPLFGDERAVVSPYFEANPKIPSF